MNKLFTTLLFCFLGQFIFAQGRITGKVVDASENAAIEFVSVALYTSNDSSLVTGAITKSDGSFSFSKLKTGNYYLTAQFMGFETKQLNELKIQKGETLELGNISMIPNEKLLDEVEVSGKKVTAMHKIDRQVFESDNFQSSQGGSAVDVLKNLPSVTVNANGEISARGANGFVVLINGKPVQGDPSIILGQLPANAIKNVELVTAPSAKYDPEGKGGLINIVTSKEAMEGTFAQINTRIGLPSIEDYDNKEAAQRYGADFTFNQKKGKWDISLGASYQRSDKSGRREGDVWTINEEGIKTSFPSDGERSFDEENYSGRFTLGFEPTKNDNFNLSFFGGKRNKERRADIEYYNNVKTNAAGDIVREPYQYYNENLRIRTGDFALGSFDYSHKFGNESRISTSFLYEYTMLGGPTTNLNLDGDGYTNVVQDQFNDNTNPLHGMRFQLDYQLKPLPIGQIEMGYQFRHLDHKGDFEYKERNLETGEFETVPEYTSTVNLERILHSGYAQLSGKKGQWTYGAGLRLEHMDRKLELADEAETRNETLYEDYLKLFPSANLQYAASDNFKIKGAYSKRVQRTTTFKMNPFREREHSETLEQGDAELLPEFIDLVELGVVKNIGDHTLSATAYYRHVQNLVNRVNRVYNDSILDRIYSNVGVANAYGLELSADVNPTRWWNVYAGVNMYQYKIDGEYDNDPINSSTMVYSINANTTFDLSPTLSVQWAINYISDRITAQGEDSRFYSPNLTVKKSFMNNRLTATFQWLNMDLGLLNTNEQRISTWREGEFYTTTNYVYEVDMLMLNISYTLNSNNKNKGKFIKSIFGAQEF
ncbi:outer membrane beta-barrel family protein [Sediminitomix flava]|uniref:Outer membrane receptor protein involved in Fe transport n=1 Tax=Sediminitomix flava TaxID=379075 RepID=A0A315ZCD5_SEDFL|nr:outer membrane beta-barrel family protein [Sediminitomix flava]PWJ43191.1 outer membrane receptor protein involved in Fe transport [Sediminitomix flava]